MDKRVAEILPFLSSGEDNAVAFTLPLLWEASTLPHGNGSLLSHLCGTARILAAEQASTDIVGAGLFHSIYSTEFYPHSALSSKRRPEVAAAIGERAENLVHKFCTIQRKELWKNRHSAEANEVDCIDLLGQHVAIPLRVFRDLLQIECANIIEQSCTNDGIPNAFMAWYFENAPTGSTRFARHDNFLGGFTEDAEVAAFGLYRAYLCDVSSPKTELLLSAIDLNPFSFELQLFCALHDYKLGDVNSAIHRLIQAESLLHTWGTPWDKRLTFANWKRHISQAKELQSGSDAAEFSVLIANELTKARSQENWSQ